MKNLLQIHSSLNGADGLSSTLAREFTEQWSKANPDGRVVTRDLAADPVPHLTAAAFAAFAAPADQRDEAGRRAVALSDRLIGELKAADVIVLGVPMYNFGVPSSLKAWFDHVARAGVTFRYTANGPVGLMTKKQGYVMAARGGVYAGTAKDSQTPWLRTMLGFLGIRDVEFVYAEGVAKGDAERRAALDKARAAIDSLDLELAA